ncbi:hypothetical protein CY658_21665 [Variovorax sp. RO1]|uniref:hypothetical protein n=1 Tax=Variovorax sp. RO1 TaxID=2066034 RepID=UPI000C7173D5|nr:hypothetical protein [Variovorax sp. RO1]PLC03426.1 hypothetical protein CY658_21665 [Variovorax sp. RO1]
MAMVSAVSICNIALAQLGANPIHSLNDAGTEAALCNTFYEQLVRAYLDKHPWNFAIRRIELPPDVETPLYQYKYQFTLPADCLRILTVDGDQKYNAEGRRIVTNKSTCFLKYVAEVTDTSQWSQGFIEVLTAAMTLRLAYPITKSADQVSLAQQNLQLALQSALAIDASEDISDDFGPDASSFIAVRF